MDIGQVSNRFIAIVTAGKNKRFISTVAHKPLLALVGGTGFEPVTSTVWRWHSPAELTARYYIWSTRFFNSLPTLKNGSFFEGTLFKILVGSAVLLGASTAYIKLEADKKFDEYLITGDQKLLDQTNRLDVISGITFVATQINFGFILYLFLTD